jgi:hypothetical protein
MPNMYLLYNPCGAQLIEMYTQVKNTNIRKSEFLIKAWRPTTITAESDHMTSPHNNMQIRDIRQYHWRHSLPLGAKHVTAA